jgi:hypothetical protein
MLEQIWDVTSLTRYHPASRDRTLFFQEGRSKEDHMNGALALLLIVVLCATVGCANMTPRQQRALSGGAIVAAGGAAVSSIVGGSPAIDAAPRFALLRGRILARHPSRSSLIIQRYAALHGKNTA